MSAPSNRKNLPAPHTPVTTGFRCEICHGLFGRPYLLKAHQQKLHGLIREPEASPPPSVTALVLPAIQTAAMDVAKARGEIPFAVLHMVNEIPLIVRVVEQGNCSVLKAAENSDFRESQRGCPIGTSVSIAVVASVYQKFDDGGQMYFEIHGPISRYQATMPQQSASEAEEVPEGMMQNSLGGGDLYKTLTQLNCLQVEYKTVGLSSISKPQQQLPVAKSASSSILKRKQPRISKQTATPIAKRPAKQPKVITLVDDHKWLQDQNVTPSRRSGSVVNYQDIATGSLLSPVRRASSDVEVLEETTEDPFADLNFQDLVQVDDGLLPDAIGDLSGSFM